MSTKNAQYHKAWRARQREKKLRQEAMFDQVLAGLVIEVVQTPDGRKAEVVIPSHVKPIFEDLAAELEIESAELFARLLKGAADRIAKGEV